jgi:hypothetical protein
LNPDLDKFAGNNDKLTNHYVNIGKMEKRNYTTDGILPPNFDYKHYLILNPDLNYRTEREAIIHYITYGCKENRNY